MSIIELIIIAIALSMDAFTVAFCRGLKMKNFNIHHSLIISTCFGFFQGLMPFLGFTVGVFFKNQIVGFDHWIAFVLLSFIGGKMIWESFKHDTDEYLEDKLGFKDIVIMGIATSIDALAVGVSFAVLKDINIFVASGLIAAICFIISFIAVIIGNKIGEKFKFNTELLGGMILVGIGVKILIEHLFFAT